MKLATFNTNSIRARMGIITSWLEKEAPDLLCLQETKVQDKDFPVKIFEELGYDVAFRGQKSYNGVAMIARSPLNNIHMNLYKDGDDQARFISAVILNIPVLNVYVPQGFAPGTEKFQYKLTWLNDLLSYINKNFDPDRPLLLAGDFNVALEPEDLYDPEGLQGQVGFHPNERDSMRRLLGWGLVDIFRRYHFGGGYYTFWDYRIPNAFKRKMGWRIDYIFTTRTLAEKATSVWIDTGPRSLEKPSDHTFLVAEFEI
jgi:exodeoxyribonuclease-3